MASALIRKAGLTRAKGQTGAVTLIQRFGSALNLNIHFHFHMLCLDGAYTRDNGRPHFRRVPPPTPAELDALLFAGGHRWTPEPGPASTPLNNWPMPTTALC
jgi:hypothetical protein